jgi:hypothetical protein
VRFTTLGTGTISLTGARSCAAYLLEAADLRLLVDCGSGTTRRLAELGAQWRTITHVALTHFHIDHHGDLPSLVFAWKYGFLPPRSEPLTIIGPVGTTGLLARLSAAYGDWLTAPGVSALDPGDHAGRCRRAAGGCSTGLLRRSTHGGECGIFHGARRAASRLYGRHRPVRRAGGVVAGV